MLIRTRARGFSLGEILVVMAIGIILAAVFLPSLVGSLDRSRVTESAESLEGIVEAAGNMWRDVDRFPGTLSQLSQPVAAGDVDLCGNAYGGDASLWNGPYLTRSIAATGLALPLGVARNALTYSASPPLMTISVDSVDEADARAMDDRVDGTSNPAAGAVRWGAVSGSGLVVLNYVRPVRPC